MASSCASFDNPAQWVLTETARAAGGALTTFDNPAQWVLTETLKPYSRRREYDHYLTTLLSGY